MSEPDWKKIELENRGLSIRSARLLGEGWTSRAYLVNNELVFRFPKCREDWRELDREIAFLAPAASELPLAVPVYTMVAPESTAAACGYAVYRYLSGNALDVNALTPQKQTAAADVIAGFLRALHAFQPSSQLCSLLPDDDHRKLAENYLVNAEREIAPKLAPSQARALRAQFELYLGEPRNFLFGAAVLHADLAGDHILVNDGSVTGVIDFGDVSWGDPDYDFMYLFVDFGEQFAAQVAQRYGHPDLAELGEKLRYFALVDQIGTILEGPGRALRGQEDAAWRRLVQLLQERDCGV